MPSFTLPDDSVNRTIEGLLSYEITQISWLGSAILASVFFVILLGGMYSSTRSTDRTKVLSWLAISSFITAFLAIMLSFAGIIGLTELIISVVLAILFVVLYFLSNIMD